ncbi:hypothetical protein, partial [Shigella sonnei]|uniref:hypothetical protein n=1 Tax=Shigella sonnei TaxID=624 RepID=UPI001C12B69B
KATPTLHDVSPSMAQRHRNRIHYLSRIDGFPTSIRYDGDGDLTLYRRLPCIVHATENSTRRVDTMRMYHLKHRRIRGFDRYGFSTM